MLFSARSWLLVSLVWLVAGVGAARAGFITDLTADPPVFNNGLYEYAYTLANASNSDLPAISLNIAVPTNADLQSITGPVGWDIVYNAGDQVISWHASDLPFALAAGSTPEFGFASAVPPGSQDFSVLGFDPDTFSFGENIGTTTAPFAVTAVPEPMSLTFLGIGIAGMTGYGWRKRKRPAR